MNVTSCSSPCVISVSVLPALFIYHVPHAVSSVCEPYRKYMSQNYTQTVLVLGPHIHTTRSTLTYFIKDTSHVTSGLSTPMR